MHMTPMNAHECPRCQIGHLQPAKTAFTRIINGAVVSVPEVKVYTCDVCAYQDFDRVTLARLQTMLGSIGIDVLDDIRPVTKSSPVEVEGIDAAKLPRPKP
jgi:protein-arginine kinase activator protein McsA